MFNEFVKLVDTTREGKWRVPDGVKAIFVEGIGGGGGGSTFENAGQKGGDTTLGDLSTPFFVARGAIGAPPHSQALNVLDKDYFNGGLPSIGSADPTSGEPSEYFLGGLAIVDHANANWFNNGGGGAASSGGPGGQGGSVNGKRGSNGGIGAGGGGGYHYLGMGGGGGGGCRTRQRLIQIPNNICEIPYQIGTGGAGAPETDRNYKGGDGGPGYLMIWY